MSINLDLWNNKKTQGWPHKPWFANSKIEMTLSNLSTGLEIYVSSILIIFHVGFLYIIDYYPRFFIKPLNGDGVIMYRTTNNDNWINIELVV